MGVSSRLWLAQNGEHGRMMADDVPQSIRNQLIR
jgi:hypothetical protein